jgi:hypothetical protein
VGNYFFGHSWRFAIYFEPLKALRRASFRATSNPGANVRFGSKADIARWMNRQHRADVIHSRSDMIACSKAMRLMACLLAMIFLTCASGEATAQQCPAAAANSPSQVRTLDGRLIYHDDIRSWFELKLDRPTCGAKSIQLVRVEGGWKDLETLRGCRISSTGPIDYSQTGYYSLDLYQDVRKTKALGHCLSQPFHDYSNARPEARIRVYSVTMHLDYRTGDHPVIFDVRSAGRRLRPWQAYASYWLTGGFILYGRCGHGFVVDKVFGPRAAHPSHFGDLRTPGDMAAFDPESAASRGQSDLRLGYTCIRDPSGKPNN